MSGFAKVVLFRYSVNDIPSIVKKKISKGPATYDEWKLTVERSPPEMTFSLTALLVFIFLDFKVPQMLQIWFEG